MSGKIYSLLILCGILCVDQILANESLDHLVRSKRVINLEEGGDVPLQNGDAPFVVHIRRTSGHITLCVGTILSTHTVITIADCVSEYVASSIEVLVGSSYLHFGIRHNVIMKNIRMGNHQRANNDGVALLTVHPAIVFNSRTGSIELHQGPLLTDMPATIFGWGCNPTAPRGTIYHARLRSITVPIMSHRDCVNSYRGYMRISDNDICIYDENKRCGHTDAGAPLVVNNQLAGLHLGRAQLPNRIGPDVFLILQSLEYAPWIRNNIIYNVVRMGGSK